MKTIKDEFVSVDINDDNNPSRNNELTNNYPANEHSSAYEDDDSPSRQRSMLKALWSEATSTTSFPELHHHQLHQRHTNVSTNTTNYARIGSTGSNASPSKRRSLTGRRGGHTHLHHSRAARVAKRVWLAAFAALAASSLIAVHIFLYRVIFTTTSKATDDINDAASMIAKYLAPEDQTAAMSLREAHSHVLKPITTHAIDQSQFTIRMNTWHRNEQLILSVNHHAKCETVKEIQIVWCDSQNEPPEDILHHVSGKVKIEKHTINNLNERFKVLLDPPTLGILSLDDDVLRPCEALDAAFLRWTRHPERMLGFDVRTHVVEESKEGQTTWKYGYMSTTEKSNRYSLTLPRASFLHRDYLDLYTMALPRPMYAYIAQHFECEDIAMSFLVSSLTGGKPPLITDYWAVKSMVKLYSESKISGGKDHKRARDKCVNDFADMLGLKGTVVDGVHVQPLQTGKIRHKDSFFGYGAEPEDWSSIEPQSVKTQHLKDLIETMQKVKAMYGNVRTAWLSGKIAETMEEAKLAGMIENTEEWKKRWKQ
ncbi:hypothetical protein ACHAXN_001341 [Cyclotella atomus]